MTDPDRIIDHLRDVALDVRVVRSDGVILAHNSVKVANAEAIGTFGGEQASAALAAGYGVAMEISDPDGVILPAGKWVRVLEFGP